MKKESKTRCEFSTHLAFLYGKLQVYIAAPMATYICFDFLVSDFK
ncbi:uncharacterized protein CELE_C32C4.16 [Caenorhabditis elegans]|uniref:Transmembrane protein n=1 Tax=Caenorhabditis elegans TaxID=6239 RepID=E9P873_CAEEL|nr:Transmembrane protein [Caenorhabditis elegans]CBZ01783.1 Transmembrane protein [Caenorhabditis elegans]|eukprot:NP_001256244.1 Uncharacterized protein CELE_C32C4.16 [Caenorhabditis elegans]